MKKSYALVLLLVLAAACATPPTNREAAPTNTAATAPTSTAISEADAIAKEKAIWDAIKNKDYEAYANTLADDQIEVAADGTYDKAASIAAVKQFEPAEISFADWKLLPIDQDAVVLTYTVTVKGKSKGKEFSLESARASSAWVHRAGKWLAMYHQECPVSTVPPPPPPKSSAAKTSETPASTPTPIKTGADPLANENAVWEALKSGNYDRFAGLLAADFIEVEPDGVYDKAGSVKAISQFDFSKTQLSDFKSVSFDKDAALATYVIKPPGRPAERHSTIWASRDGKWLAVFHHGTPISGTAAAATPAPKLPAATPSPE
jgi:hypothetical protein